MLISEGQTNCPSTVKIGLRRCAVYVGNNSVNNISCRCLKTVRSQAPVGEKSIEMQIVAPGIRILLAAHKFVFLFIVAEL